MTLKDKNLYYVGGVVRDEILGTQSFDTDFCYEGNAIEYARKSGLNIIKENPDFGTVRVTPPQTSPSRECDPSIDIASTREETYPQAGHLPVIKNIGCSLKNDLKRRDFTINAMAKNTVTGDIIDYFGGIKDIRNKKLKVLHSKSFIDDPTRILRGLKFAVRFGFELDDETKKLQDDYLDNINYDMSYHRLKKELKETFNLNKEEAYKKFIEQGIYKLLGGNITPSQYFPSREGVSALIDKYKPYKPWLVWLGLFDLSNLELTGEEQKIIDSIPNVKPKNDFETYKLFNNLPLETVLLYALSIDYDIAINYLDRLKNIKIKTTGKDLKQLGIPNGKIYKEIFDFLLEEKIKNPQTDEIKLVKEKYGFI